jgi:hypothetical protein
MHAKPDYYGTCLVNGHHLPGSQAERECPLGTAAARSERSRRAAATRSRKAAVASPGSLGGAVAGPDVSEGVQPATEP